MLKVSTPDGKLTRLVEASQRQEYIDKGWIIEDTSEVEMMLDEDGNTMWRYKEDTEWNTISGGIGTDTYKVKVDGTDTAEYLEDKLVQGTNVTISKADGKLVINSTGGSGSIVTYDEWRLTNAYTLGNDVVYSDSKVYKANDTVPANTPFATGTTGATWTLQTIPDGTYVNIKKIRNTIANALITGTEEVILNGQVVNNEIVISKNTRNNTAKKLVFVGSSVCAGTGAATYAESYAGLLTAKLGTFTDIKYVNIKNKAVGGNTSSSVISRFTSDVLSENPDLVVIGLSCNNEGITVTGADATLVDAYISNIIKITSLCDKNGIDYFVMGDYGSNLTVANGWETKKLINFNLQKIFKHRFINTIGSVTVDSTGYWKTGANYDNLHPNSVGFLSLYNNINPFLFSQINKNRREFIPTTNGSVLASADAIAFVIYPIDINSTTDYLFEYTAFLDVKLTETSVQADKVLLKGKSLNGATTSTATVRTDANGFICLYEGNTLKYTSTIKLSKIYTTQVGIRSNAIDNTISLIINGSVLASYTPSVALGYNLYQLTVGCNGVSGALTAQNFELSNLALYRGCLDLYTISMIAKKDYPQSNLIFANSLNSISSSSLMLTCEAGNSTIGVLKAANVFTTNTNVNRIYTDAEKEKLTAVNAVGTAVASATTITVPSNKTIFHITGTTAISTINLPYTGFTGKISIIPDGIFTFDTAGNIAEAYTATVNRCIDLVYDGTKWYRV